MNEKVKWKLAFKNLEKQTKMNVLIFLQLAILLLICMSCVSVFFPPIPISAAQKGCRRETENCCLPMG